ncbi:MAG: sigma 54-interacting transcriptional regulator [Holophaga sp.]|nr:sigma 54-interacting transcriptional regulator [Holophaga sp.]
MAKKVALITAFSKVAEVHRQTLEALFRGAIELRCYSYDVANITGPIDADLFLISIYQIYLNLRPFIAKNAKAIIISNTLTEEQYQRIAAMPAGLSVLLVNYSVEMTMDTISLFHRLGLNHLDLVPCYPGTTHLPQLETAVTPGEPQHVPPWVKQVVDIGDRVIDAKTMIDLATGLGLERLLKEDRFIEYFQSIRHSPDSVTSLFDRTNILEGQLSSLLDVMDDGIIIIENNGMVYACNRKAREVLDRPGDLVDCKASDLIPGIPFDRVMAGQMEVDYTLVKINSRDVSIKVVPVVVGRKTRGALAIINKFEDKERSQHRLRSQLLGKGHRARYTFEQILTRDPDFIELKDLARKKAKSDASVLIIGETGTGKELFAHAIHNASRRKEWQFVTVNCAALPESLLESELFGYEEGAFTGARRGGKPGLFELAHQGTIFLDEIGEMDLNLQTRLLRVLESREVMRIGGDSMIHIDIRIIAATNKDLWSLVEQGQFRRDLYYRLNVLPIQVPPLRERRDDILFLLDHLKRQIGVELTITPETAELLVRYPWHGNVRELKNCAEYLAYLDKRTIEARDLAPFLKWPEAGPRGGDPGLAAFREGIGVPRDHYMFILECLYGNHQNRLRSGRRSLVQIAQKQDLFLTEAQIRKALVQMESFGYVHLHSGRGGSTITPEGIEALKQLRNQRT